jgi:hypothetical protein
MEGKKTLDEMRFDGLNTEVVKKCKTKRRTIMAEGAPPVEELEVEIELFDRSGADFDRILDRTAGRARQVVDLRGEAGKAMASPMIIIETLDSASAPRPGADAGGGEGDDDE